MASTMLTNSTPVPQTGMPRLFVPARGAVCIANTGFIRLTSSFGSTAPDWYAVQRIAQGQSIQAGKAWDRAYAVIGIGLVATPGMAGHGRSAPIARRC
jgi:hypothetical protein